MYWEYLKRAVECQQKAETAASTAAQEFYREAQASWLAMADGCIESRPAANGRETLRAIADALAETGVLNGDPRD